MHIQQNHRAWVEGKRRRSILLLQIQGKNRKNYKAMPSHQQARQVTSRKALADAMPAAMPGMPWKCKIARQTISRMLKSQSMEPISLSLSANGEDWGGIDIYSQLT